MSRSAAAAAMPAHEAQPAEGLRFSMPRGLLGFEDEHEFVLVEEPDSPVCWLQASDEPQVALPVIEAFLIYPEYNFDLSDAEAAALKLEGPADATVLVVLTARAEPPMVTANLLAPIVLNRAERQALQIVLADTQYPMRYPVLTDKPAAGEVRRGGKRRND